MLFNKLISRIPFTYSCRMKSNLLIILTVACTLCLAWEDANVTDPDIVAAAQRSVRLYEEDIHTEFALRLVRLFKAQTQVESNGTRYRFEESVGSTNCSRDQENDDPSDCAVLRTDFCSIQTFESGSDAEIVTGGCTRFLKRTKNLPAPQKKDEGGWHDVSTDNPQVVISAERALSMYETESGSNFALRMVKILSAQMQVVAGVRYNFLEEVGVTNCSRQQEDANSNNCFITSNQICNFTTFEQVWTDTYQLESSECHSKDGVSRPAAAARIPSVVEEKNSPTLPPLDGGWQPLNTSDPDVIESAERAVRLYETDSKSNFALRMTHLIRAEAQIVAGVQYKFLETVAVTNCTREQEDADSQNCAVQRSMGCSFETLEQAWTGTYILEASECFPEAPTTTTTTTTTTAPAKQQQQHLKRDSLPEGSWQEVNTSLPQVQEAAERAVRLYETDSLSTVALRMLKLLSAELQVVAGLRYRFLEEVGATNCTRQAEDADASLCFVETKLFCNFTTFEQSWTNTYVLESSSCIEPFVKPKK